MLSNYAECERRVLLSEGGYTNDPNDPGGPTNWGITLHDARAYWKPDATAEDVRAMPRSVAEGIYKSKYWDALDCDNLVPGVDYSVFDYGVNSGIGRAGKVLRAVLGMPTDTYEVTDEVIQKLTDADPVKIVDAINDERLSFLMHLRTWPHFGKGWGARVRSVKAYSDHLAQAFEQDHPGAAPAHAVGDGGSAKAYGDDVPIEANKPPIPAWLSPQKSPVVRSPETPARDVAGTVLSHPNGSDTPSTSRAKPWFALGLGSIGGLEWFRRLDDYMSTLSDAKLNWDSLHLSLGSIVHWLYGHPFFLLPPAVIGIAIWLWQDHKNTKRLIEELKNAQRP